MPWATDALVTVVCPDCGATRQVKLKVKRRCDKLGRPYRCWPCGNGRAHPPAPAPGAPLCRHCGVRPVNRPRGMCWGCHGKPEVRSLYPSTSKYARRGVRNFVGPAPAPAEPTAAAPGTEEKVAVLAMRAAAGQQLFHRSDAA
jgi:hypothetical protein